MALFKTLSLVLVCVSFVITSVFAANDTTPRTNFTSSSIAGNYATPTSPQFTTILVFGDSTVDAGNNNYIATLFKGNNPPYGENYPGHIATGRFSDGKIVPDFLASYLGIKEVVPPFLEPYLSDDELRSGVNFASAGSGFDELTTLLSMVIPVSRQVELFRSYISRLKGIVGEEEANRIIGEALVVISAGTNDLIFDYFDVPLRRIELGGNGYQNFLLQRVQNFIEELYGLGCRKIVVAGLPPIGCLPIQMTLRLENPNYLTCLEDQNSYAQSYNQNLWRLLRRMQATLPNSKVVYADIYKSFANMINHPRQHGFVETKRGCCGTGRLLTSFMCNSWTPVCRDPSKYLFWDSIHPTQAAYRYIAEQIEKEVIPKLI